MMALPSSPAPRTRMRRDGVDDGMAVSDCNI